MWLLFIYVSDNFKDQCEKGIGPIEIPYGEGENQMLLTYYSSNPLKPNATCVISVFNPDRTYPPSVIAHFISFGTDYSQGCLHSRMDIYDGNDTNPNKALTGIYDAYIYIGSIKKMIVPFRIT